MTQAYEAIKVTFNTEKNLFFYQINCTNIIPFLHEHYYFKPKELFKYNAFIFNFLIAF